MTSPKLYLATSRLEPVPGEQRHQLRAAGQNHELLVDPSALIVWCMPSTNLVGGPAGFNRTGSHSSARHFHGGSPACRQCVTPYGFAGLSLLAMIVIEKLARASEHRVDVSRR